MAECLCIPVAFGAAWCCFGGGCGVATGALSTIDKNNKIAPYDDERPRKMTPEEYNMYCLHMNAYGGHHNKNN